MLSVLLVFILLLGMIPAAFADGDVSGIAEEPDETVADYEPDEGEDTPAVIVIMQVSGTIELREEQSRSVSATVYDADSGARYDWHCSDPNVLSIRGNKDSVDILALKPGRAEVSLTVTRADGQGSDSDSFEVEVKGSAKPVSVTGGNSVSVEEGKTEVLSASVSGGSGSYEYVWDAGGEAALAIMDRMRGDATIHAGQAGTGWVILTVYDAENHSNNDSTRWDFTVKDLPKVEHPTVTLDRGSIDIAAGQTGTLNMEVSGGSGSYEYVWESDNTALVDVYGSGENVSFRAGETLVGGKGTATITAYVHDSTTGLHSNTVSCSVHVTGGYASCDASGNASAGGNLAMDSIMKTIAAGYLRSFGQEINLGANVYYDIVSGNAGSLRLQDGTAVRSGTGYAFAASEDMYFDADMSGSFRTGYAVKDGGNTLTGAITISVSGGVGVKGASLSAKSVRMTTGSNQNLSLSVSPAAASYSVEWDTSNDRIVSVIGGGSQVTLRSGGYTGNATVTAIIADANGARSTCAAAVAVVSSESEDPELDYSPTVAIAQGSEYYCSGMADTLANQFQKGFKNYPGNDAKLYVSSLGKSLYGTMFLRNGSTVQKMTTYSFRDFADMYFVPGAAGTYSMSYRLTYRNRVMRGTISFQVQSSSLTVTLSPNTLVLTPYSNQMVSLNVSPANAYFRVNWVTGDSRIATVNGSNTGAVVSAIGGGTTTITAIVTDSRGVEIRHNCNVVVSGATGGTYNTTVAAVLGSPYVGTGSSSTMRNHFRNVYNMELGDNAIIRFGSTGNNNICVLRLADGTAMRANTDYTLAQYVGAYLQTVSAGTYSIPYTLTYSGKSLSGTASAEVRPASLSTTVRIDERKEYSFSDSLKGTTGAAMFSDSIRNTIGGNWSYLRFSKVSDGTGTIYRNRNRATLNAETNVTPDMLSQLCFVPGSLNGNFSVPYTVYSAAGMTLANGTLTISTQGISFSDVPSGAYYEGAVDWAVNRGVTSGTGGSNFSPAMTVTRGQAVTFLWRAAGQPKSATPVSPFNDVQPGAFYYDAVLWAVQQGITNGTGDKTFAPELPLHRDQLLTFLCRANGGYAGGNDWANLAVNWATERGLLAGVPGKFVAAENCPRSDVVYYLWKNYTA